MSAEASADASAAAAAGTVTGVQELLERVLPYATDLPPHALAALAGACEERTYRFGDSIIEEGEHADAAYILVEGYARALRMDPRGHEVHLSRLEPGAVFGEIALVRGGLRTATVRASAPVSLLLLSCARYQPIALAHPEIAHLFERQARLREVRDALRRGPLGVLDEATLSRVARAFAQAPSEPVGAGAAVLRQGDPPGPAYLVEAGRLRAMIGVGADERVVGYLRAGDIFGELASLSDAPRRATVEACAPSRVTPLAREVLLDLRDEMPALERALADRAATYADLEAATPLDFSAAALLRAPTSGYAPVRPRARADAPPSAGPDAVVAPSAGAPGVPLGRALGARDGSVIDRASAGSGDDSDAVGLAPLDAAHARSHSSARERKRFPLVWQIDEADCGPACLAMVCRHFGRRVALGRLRALARTRHGGASLKALVRTARAVGLRASAQRVSASDLDRLPLPAILHVFGNHWVCLHRLEGDGPGARVCIADPATGLDTWARSTLAEAWTGFACLVAPTDAFREQPADPAVGGALRQLAAEAWAAVRGRAILAVAALGSAVASVVGLVGAVGHLIDRAAAAGAARLAAAGEPAEWTSSAWLCAGLLGAAALARAVAHALGSAAVWTAERRGERAIARALLARPLAYLLERRGVDLERRLEAPRALGALATSELFPGAEALALGLAAVFGLGLARSPMALLAAVALLGGAAMAWVARRPMRAALGASDAARDDQRARVREAVRAAEATKAGGAAHAAADRLAEQLEAPAAREALVERVIARRRRLVQATAAVLVLVALLLSAHDVAAGRATPGALVVVVGLTALAGAAGARLVGLGAAIELALVHAQRVEDILEDAWSSAGGDAAPIAVPAITGKLQVEALVVRYGGPEGPAALDGVSLEVEPGDRVLIAGRRGAGKSTLARALVGLLPAEAGAIRYDGVRLAALDADALRAHVAVAVEAPEILAATLAQNVAFGAEPDLDRVHDALRVADAMALMQRLAHGLDEPLGEGGTALGLDDRQRIGVARAVYREPTLLILDDATSALDPDGERRLLTQLERRLRGSTIVALASRPCDALGADRVAVLDAGRVVEHGTREDLVRLGGLYAHLVGRRA